jgi:hypothetical protein
LVSNYDKVNPQPKWAVGFLLHPLFPRWAEPCVKTEISYAKGRGDENLKSRRFVETAEKLGVDKSGKSFERAVKKIIKPSQKKLPPS